MAFVRRAPKRVQHLLLVLLVAAGLLTPLQLANSSSVSAAVSPLQVGIGPSFACAMNPGGQVQCWGNNDNGHLGNGTVLSSAKPVNVSQGSMAYSSLSVGGTHVCGLTSAGQTYCWGSTQYGQGGAGSTATTVMAPTAVTQSGVAYGALSMGNQFSCALTSAGQTYCWGYDSFGQLGDGLTANRTTPNPVTQGGVTFTSIAMSNAHSCGLTSGGQAYCWGWGGRGQIGNGSTASQGTPVPVTQGAVTFASLYSGGNQACGLTSGGQAYCWGNNTYGQLGNGATASSQSTPVAVTQGGITFVSMALGSTQTCGLTAAGQSYCWGLNVTGSVGDGTTTDRNTPVAVSQSGVTFSKIASGNTATVTCGMSSSTSRLYCWGERAGSAIGDGVSAGQSTTPIPVSQGSASYIQTAEGQSHTCGLSTAGQTYCWGYNANGQLGNGGGLNQAAPVAVSQSAVVYASIVAGQAHSCGLTSGGQAYCWGNNTYGQLGNNSTTQSNVPVTTVQSGITYASIVSATNHVCGLTSGGQAYCWGSGTSGQLGNGGTSNSSVPVPVTQGGVTFVAITAGAGHSCGLTGAGQTYCWGAGTNYQMGNGGNTNVLTPTAVTQSAITYVSIAAGANHTCGLTSAGQTYCWGFNASGQLGNGNQNSQATPVAVTQSGAVFASLTSGNVNTCGLTSGGVAYCWGGNGYGSVGDGTTTFRLSAIAVSQGSVRWTSISSGSYANHICALDNGGRAYCWGYDLNGQLGAYSNVLTPTIALYMVDSETATASASIDPSFTFSIAGRAAACNGASTPTGAATPSAIDLGHLSSASPVLGAQDFTAATNAGSGFSVSVKFSGPLTSTSGATFANASGSAGTPTAFGSSEAFGYTTSANAGFSGPLWAGPTTSYASLYTTSAPTASVSNCIAYQAQAGPLTPAGAYSVTVIYLATPTF